MLRSFADLFQSLAAIIQSKQLSAHERFSQFQQTLQQHSQFNQFILESCWQELLDHAYSRSHLTTSEGFEVMVARWNPGVACEPHDHGGAQGLVWFVQGDFLEREYSFDNSQLLILRQKNWAAGELTWVTPNEIHDCVAKSAGLSVHFYWPRAASMQIFSAEQKKTIRVNESVGAWRLVPQSAILQTTDWQERV